MVNHYVMKLEHDLFIDCLPYEWRSGTSDGLFLPIYPPRSMRVVLCFDICNKYVSSLLLTLSPWIIHTLTLPPLLASLVLRKLSPVPYTHYIPSWKQPPYLPIMAFPSHSEIYCHATFHRFIYYDTLHHYHIALHDHVVDIVIVAKPPFKIFIHVTLESLHIPIHRRKHSYRLIFCSSIEL